MKMKTYLEISAISNWERVTQELADTFIIKYFGKDTTNEFYWVADEIGDVLYVNDRFFNLTDIVYYLKAGYSPKDMFRHYDYVLECNEKNESPINIKNWKKLK